MLYVKIGALAGLVIAIPLILGSSGSSSRPGLYSHEKKFADSVRAVLPRCFS